MSEMGEIDDVTRKARLDSILIDSVDMDRANAISSDFMDLMKADQPIGSQEMLGSFDLIVTCDHCSDLMSQILRCMGGRESGLTGDENDNPV